ncbi:MAG: AEC family transporter [Candidatus Thorarchaeota archaeon]
MAIQTIDVLVTQIFLFYGFIVVGYLIARLSGKGQTVNGYLNSLLINVLVPILVIYALLTSTPTSLIEIPIFLVITVVIHLLGPVLIYLRLRSAEIKDQKKGSLFICSTFNNALFVPLPLALMFIGPTSISFVIIFSLTQMILFVTFGSVMGATFSGKEAGWKKIARDAVTFPPFLAALLTLVLLGLNVSLPTDLVTILSYNSPLTTYLALVSVGLGVGVRFSLADLRTALNVIAIRQLIIPLIMIPIILLSTLSSVPIQVLILESLMPSAILTVVYASGFNLDVEIASTTVTVGTLLLLPLIPILPFVLG